MRSWTDLISHGQSSVSRNAIEVYVHRLRKVLEERSAKVVIETIKGVGYLIHKKRDGTFTKCRLQARFPKRAPEGYSAFVLAPKELPMRKLLARIARPALCAAIITGSGLVLNGSYAAPLKFLMLAGVSPPDPHDPGGDCADPRPDKSIEACTHILQTGPVKGVDIPMALYNRGRAHLLAGHTQDAIQDLSEAIRLRPNFAKSWVNRGDAYFAEGQTGLAISDYTAAIALDAHHAGAFYNRGNAEARLGKFTEAIGDLTAAICLNPEFAGAFYNRGICWVMVGKPDKAVADVRRALELNPAHEGAKKLLRALEVDPQTRTGAPN